MGKRKSSQHKVKADKSRDNCSVEAQTSESLTNSNRSGNSDNPKISEKDLPRICLNMIVKDEAHIIKEVLTSVSPYLNYWIILDTGSTDGTQKIIQDFFEEKGIPGELHEDPWRDDFGYSRSLALKLCQGKAQYAWVIDADDLLVGTLPLPESMTADVYELIYHIGTKVFSRNQIFKISSDWRYEGIRHEGAVCGKSPYIEHKLLGNYYIHARTLGNRSADPKKYYRDAQAIEKALIDQPNNTRYLFYCAQSYRDAGPEYIKQSIQMYLRRINTKGGFYEEIFISWLEIARHYRTLNKSPEKIRKAYLNAFKALPSRSESLDELSKYYRLVVKDYRVAYEYAKKAARIPFPDLKLFLNEPTYLYEAQINLALCALLVGKTDEALRECQQLLKEAELRKIPPGRREWILAFKSSLEKPFVSEDQLSRIYRLESTSSQPQSLSEWIDFLTSLSADYLFFPNLDCIGHDLLWEKSDSFERSDKTCRNLPNGLAFNNWGYHKADLGEPSSWVQPDEFKPNDGLYVHRKKYLEYLINRGYPEKNPLSQWLFFPQKDSFQADLSYFGHFSLNQLAEWTESHPEAVGFNTRGWVKHYIRPEDSLNSTPGQYDGIYIHPERWAMQQKLFDEL